MSSETAPVTLVLQRRSASWVFVAVLGLCVAAAGCRGSARVELASLNYRSIDPPPPRIARLDLDRCFWWDDENGQVCIAMETARRPLFGVFGEFVFQLSFVLEKPPAGESRNYTVARRELRALARFALSEGRFVSAAGIVALYREKNDRLRGSFRLLAHREVSRLLGGWGRPSSYLIQGTFEAVHDEQRGRRIAEATESQGWDREPPRTPFHRDTSPGAEEPAQDSPAPLRVVPAPTTQDTPETDGE